MNEHIHEEVVVSSSPADVYAALTESSRFSAMTGGAPAEIDATDGGAFRCFGGMIEGRNVLCVPGQRLVQAWRAKTWEPGVYSMVRFELKPEGEGTRLILDHAAFPAGQAEHLGKGWHTNYLEPLAKIG